MLTKEKTISNYTDELGSNLPAPGGGGAAALSAALGASLLMMVANLTIGKKKYLIHDSRLKELIEILEKKKNDFLDLSDADEEAFVPLSNAYRLPKNTEEQISIKLAETERCLYKAAEVPMQVLIEVYNTIGYADELCHIGSRLAVSDVGAGVNMLRAAGDTAYLNIIINTKLMQDREKAANINIEADRLKKLINTEAEQIYAKVCSSILS